MAHTTNGSTQQARRAALHRRSRPSAPRRGPLDDGPPQPRRAPETEREQPESTRPRLNWVLITDENGRTRPEARWRV
ncbi:hypothetical protein [Halostreptopolyspora alba]|uniref:Uncharacterized protein n=1 Tax=Halostreptopolyspora alba TaxID=2487137 RepID=A0A3N0E5T6_9ACTN|nr:hypothetical protein EFW17_17050 [Nocardiopsaceae bacterium YIM 96095]